MAAPADAGFIAAIENDRELKQFVGEASGRSEQEYRDCLEVSSNLGLLIVESTTRSEAIGLCGLLSGQWCADCEVRVILRKDYWGRGIATEVLAALQVLAGDYYPQKEVTAKIHPQNCRSLTLARRIGYIERGVVASGRYRGWVHFSLPRERSNHAIQALNQG